MDTIERKKDGTVRDRHFGVYVVGFLAGAAALVGGLLLRLPYVAAPGFIVMCVSLVFVNYAVMDAYGRSGRFCGRVSRRKSRII